MAIITYIQRRGLLVIKRFVEAITFNNRVTADADTRVTADGDQRVSV